MSIFPGPPELPRFDYADDEVPEEYRCTRCGAHGCKLWKEYRAFSSPMICARCASMHGAADITRIDAEGTIPDEFERGKRTNIIGGFVPAIPDEKAFGYWTYFDTPPEAWGWWLKLPTLPKA